MALRLSLKLRGRRAPEPVSRLPIAWGDHRDRALVGAALIAGGAALIAQTGAFTLALGLLGSVLLAAGWLVQPGRPRTRALSAVVATLACWCALGGAQTMWPLALLLPCWLAVRRRPPVTQLLGVVPLVTAVALGSALPYVADKPVVFGGTGAAIVLCATAARELALRVRMRLTLTGSMAPTPRAGGTAPVD